MLAKLLQAEYAISILGFGESDDVWEPVRNDEGIDYRRYFHGSVAGTFLQERYGGYWIGQARDENLFDRSQIVPAPSPAKTVLFLGSAREHKGLQDLVAAWPAVTDSDAVLRIVGTPLDSAIIRAL